ncbi:MAG: twin-arginine translocation signal domain-containing protein, partial [Selenomonadaceae bacterium]|nr:twin-arginine translocation signal domain-containing protein [Selenomonadaceae bacterium]
MKRRDFIKMTGVVAAAAAIADFSTLEE